MTFTLQEQSYSVARERVIYQNERVCRGNTSITVKVSDVHPGYQHIFSVRHRVELVGRGECEGEAATTTFEFGECLSIPAYIIEAYFIFMSDRNI